MNKLEFDSLMGKKTSGEEFDEANKVYMSEPDTDKKMFCKIWYNADDDTRKYLTLLAALIKNANAKSDLFSSLYDSQRKENDKLSAKLAAISSILAL